MSAESSPETEISCSNCAAACCRAGGTLVLDSSEFQLHRAAMKLRAIVKARNHPQKAMLFPENSPPVIQELPAGVGLYSMGQDCARIDANNGCSIYDDPSRPKACANYQVGSEQCLIARANAGLDQG